MYKKTRIFDFLSKYVKKAHIFSNYCKEKRLGFGTKPSRYSIFIRFSDVQL